ncbi:MAG: phosphoenolpyruvate--protein phosphotransferase [Bryobacteraceae bacterium]|jgi:fructose-specific PTS system IIA-like component
MPLEFSFAFPLANGLHARPASHLAEAAKRFASDCALTNQRSGAVASLRSVLALVAADVRPGDACRVEVSGVDEETACDALREFIERRLADEIVAQPVAESRAGRLPRALRNAGVGWHPGIAVSPGIGQGRVVVIGRNTLPEELRREVAADPRRERHLLQGAVAAVRARIQAALERESSPTAAAVLEAHLAIAQDDSLADKLDEGIAQGRSAGQAVIEARDFFAGRLRGAESQYIRERAADVEDICQQLLEEIYGPALPQAGVELTEPSVAVAESLAPRQLLALDRRWLQGLVLGWVGTTSHVVILARSLGIPALTEVQDTPRLLASGQEVVVDANRGLVVTGWTAAVQQFYERERNRFLRRQAGMARCGRLPAITADGWRLEVAANVSSAEELLPAFEMGAEGIGVFRTEMLFMNRERPPSEEEQSAVYVEAARAAAGRPVVIHTLDIGGDKPLPYLHLPREANPFLGCRGMRLYAEHAELFGAQLRAIVRASAFGPIQVMAPMVSSLAETRWFKARVAATQRELKAQGIGFDPAMPVGIMVEIPALAFILDQLCPEVDSFSIGTNDLAQYFFAADRGNPRVTGLASVRHPSFLRLLKQIVDQVHKGGKRVCVCGEMAGDVRNLPLTVALGLDEISVAAPDIPALKAAMSRLSAAGCRQLLSRALACREVEDVDALLESEQQRRPAPPLLDLPMVLLDSPSQTKEEAIQELVDAFYVAGRTDDPEQLEEAAWAREAAYSTGLGHGFAIPHCKTDAVRFGSIGVLKPKEPIEWGSLDGAPVRVVILLATRQSGADTAHM